MDALPIDTLQISPSQESGTIDRADGLKNFFSERA